MKSNLIVPARAQRLPTREVRVGSVSLGGNQPILIQSMTVSDTCDTDSVVAEIRRLVEVGCPLVRVTAPSIKDAENLREIKRRLRNDGIHVPLVADIHFTPNAALLAAEIVEKVRVNPGNYADRKKFKVFEVSDADYQEGMEKIRDRFLPLVQRLKDHGTALRIGTNHGSLSDRIMNRYGDTPEGMVESALEFARICRAEDFHDIVFSMKSSIPKVMIAAYRLLVDRMLEEGMDYPLHIGVTEAGNGLEGRIKSTIGIGTLLRDGIGDTIRVSLTEDAEFEIGACHNILEALDLETEGTATASANARPSNSPPPETGHTMVSPSELSPRLGELVSAAPQTDSGRRKTRAALIGRWKVGGDHPIRVETTVTVGRDGSISNEAVLDQAGRELGAEVISVRLEDPAGASAPAYLQSLARRIGIVPLILEWPSTQTSIPEALQEQIDGLSLPAPLLPAGHASTPELDASEIARFLSGLPGFADGSGKLVRWKIPFTREDGSLRQPDPTPILEAHEKYNCEVILSCLPGPRWIGRVDVLVRQLDENALGSSALISLDVPMDGASAPLLAGTLLLKGIGDVLHLHDWDEDATGPWPRGGIEWTEDPVQGGYQILQACRIRLTKTEFIACPSCGRTQFNLQSTTAKIRARTEHLKGVKIAIMGCIVNGPGEMADADFGYVGSGVGKIDLYVGKERVEKSIPEALAEDRLVQLLEDHGVWIAKP